MEFALEQRRILLRDSIRDFVKKECPSTLIREIDQKGEFPIALYKSLGELGYLGINYPEKYGGAEGDTFDLALVLEGLAYGAYSLAVAYRQSAVLGGMSILLGGSEQLKKQILPAVTEAENILTWTLTEQDVASDAGFISTRAEQKDGNLIINGTKMFVYAADVAHYCTVVVRTSGEQNDLQGITTVLVPLKGTEGISLTPLRKMGTWPVKAFEVTFKDVVVPMSNVLGTINEGWALAQKVLEVERIMSAASSAGACQRMVDDAAAYAKQRIQFDQPISKFQAVAHMIADMHAEAEAVRYMAYRTAWLHARGKDSAKDAAFAKLYCSKTSQRIANNGIQVLGGSGYMAEFDMERYYRDSRRESYSSGTAHVEREMLVEMMGL